MSVDTSKLITTARLNHYHSRLNSTVISPLQAKINNKASNPDIDEAIFNIVAEEEEKE